MRFIAVKRNILSITSVQGSTRLNMNLLRCGWYFPRSIKFDQDRLSSIVQHGIQQWQHSNVPSSKFLFLAWCPGFIFLIAHAEGRNPPFSAININDRGVYPLHPLFFLLLILFPFNISLISYFYLN